MRLQARYRPDQPYSWDEQQAILERLLKLQAEKVLKVWLVGGIIRMDRCRPLWETPSRRYFTWEEAKKVADEGKLPDWKN